MRTCRMEVIAMADMRFEPRWSSRHAQHASVWCCLCCHRTSRSRVMATFTGKESALNALGDNSMSSRITGTTNLPVHCTHVSSVKMRYSNLLEVAVSRQDFHESRPWECLQPDMPCISELPSDSTYKAKHSVLNPSRIW